MSEKASQIKENSGKKKVLKWVFVFFLVSVLTIGTIFATVWVVESRSQTRNHLIDELAQKTDNLAKHLNQLSTLSNDIGFNAQQIAETNGNLNLLIENFKALKEEVGNRKIELLNQQLATISHRMETVEETKNQEALILGVALMIKENALYNRNFAQEVDILNELAQNQDVIQPELQVLSSLKNTPIIANDKLAQSYAQVIERFEFEPTPEQAVSQEKGAVAKSLDLIKNTVTGINFDKVVMVKKDNKTAEQKQLITQLTNLVEHYNFEKAILFINQNDAFKRAENKSFEEWFKQVQDKVAFDKAISVIIRTELNAMREDFKNKLISAPTDDEPVMVSPENH